MSALANRALASFGLADKRAVISFWARSIWPKKRSLISGSGPSSLWVWKFLSSVKNCTCKMWSRSNSVKSTPPHPRLGRVDLRDGCAPSLRRCGGPYRTEGCTAPVAFPLSVIEPRDHAGGDQREINRQGDEPRLAIGIRLIRSGVLQAQIIRKNTGRPRQAAASMRTGVPVGASVPVHAARASQFESGVHSGCTGCHLVMSRPAAVNSRFQSKTGAAS